jgi:hypothetical protein
LAPTNMCSETHVLSGPLDGAGGLPDSGCRRRDAKAFSWTPVRYVSRSERDCPCHHMPKMAMMPLHRPSAGGARVRIHLRERMGYIAAGKGGNSSFFAGFLIFHWLPHFSLASRAAYRRRLRRSSWTSFAAESQQIRERLRLKAAIEWNDQSPRATGPQRGALVPCLEGRRSTTSDRSPA